MRVTKQAFGCRWSHSMSVGELVLKYPSPGEVAAGIIRRVFLNTASVYVKLRYYELCRQVRMLCDQARFRLPLVACKVGR